jgi:glutamyl-tRNA reductase
MGDDAIKHLFKVTCGLDSIIIGEDQILSQIKKTYFRSLSENTTCPELNKIFNNAIAVGKKFRNESRISAKALSLERISINFIKQHFDAIENKKVFLIGTGDLSQSLLYILKKEGIKDIIITNRSTHNSKTVEQNFQVETVDYENKYQVINASDIIVSATSAPHFIIKFKDMKKHLTIFKERFFLDLAVPRDIEENIRNLNGVTLYNIDDLWDTYNNNTGVRSDISAKYMHLLDEQLRECRQWYEKRNEARLV